jgi:hypothetical protein
MRLSGEAQELILAGTATIVATRDTEMRPTLTRGWGVRFSEDGGLLTLCVGIAPGSPVRAHLEENGEIAITCSRPTTYRTTQVKGKAEVLGEPDERQLAAVAAHVEAFSAEVILLGLPDDAGARLADDGLLAVAVSPRELFDQTPGPGAGAAL